MITKDYIRGYVEALNHLLETLESFIEAEELLHQEGAMFSEELVCRIEAFEQTIQYVSTVKQNYQQLVEKLNQENQ